MSRYVNDLPTALSAEEIARVTDEYMASEGFKVKDWKGETVWQKGGGWAATPQLVKVTPGQGSAHIEAWLAGFALLPGIYLGEMDLSGGFGFAVKAMLKPRVAELERRLAGGGPA